MLRLSPLLTRSRVLFFVLPLLLLTAVVALPSLAAQEVTPEPNNGSILVIGAVSFNEAGQLVVADYVIDPAGAFDPATLTVGDIVIIEGLPLGDGTLQAVELTPFEDDDEATPESTVEATVEATQDPEATAEPGGNQRVTICHATSSATNPYNEITISSNALPAHEGHGDLIPAPAGGCPDSVEATAEPTAEPTMEATVEVTAEPTQEMTPEATVEATVEATQDPEATSEPTAEPTAEATDVADGCNRPGHPVAQALADEFGVSYDDVMGMHCAGNGFGEIARAFLLADAAGTGTAQELLDRHAAGEGWGQIVRDSGVHPSDLAPGRVIGRGHRDDLGLVTPTAEVTDIAGSDTTGTDTTDDQDDASGNANGNANANANGNGNGNANGNANGNGNGNANGNANGNSNQNDEGSGDQNDDGDDASSSDDSGDEGSGGNGNGNSNGNGNGNSNGNGNGNSNG